VAGRAQRRLSRLLPSGTPPNPSLLLRLD
jgi:hypothetical protein